MKVLKIAAVSILALGLVLGVALPGLAASDSASLQASNILPEVLRGRVVSIDENQEFLVIQSGEQKLAISVNDHTKYFKLYVPRSLVALVQHRMQLMQPEVQIEPVINQMPQLKKRAMEILKHQRPNLKRLSFFSDMTIGDRVAVSAVWGEDSYLAKTVVIMKPTTYARVSGTITDISLVNRTIAIAPADGSNDIILNYNEKTGFILRGTTELEEAQSAHAVYDEEMTAKVILAG